MYRLRCTKKLLDRLPFPVEEESASVTDTRLGNWYATRLSTRPFLALFMNERTLLPLVIEYASVKTLPQRFVEMLGVLLRHYGIPEELVKAEQEAMLAFQITKTDSRKLLGSMNDFVRNAEWHYRVHPEKGLMDLTLWLARFPCAPVGFSRPDDLTKELFNTHPQ